MTGRHQCRVVWFIAPAALMLLSVAVAADEDISFLVKLNKADDTVVTRTEGDRTIVLISTTSGIGRATLTSKEGHWPSRISLRLRYAHNKPFTTLEGLEITTSRWQVRGNSSQSSKIPFFLADGEGKYLRDDVNPSGWLNLAIKPRDNDLDLALPTDVWRGEKEVRLQWIDFYR